jgi:hypothetical protein
MQKGESLRRFDEVHFAAACLMSEQGAKQAKKYLKSLQEPDTYQSPEDTLREIKKRIKKT